MLGMLPIKFDRVNQKGPDTFQTRLLVREKVIKWTKEATIVKGDLL